MSFNTAWTALISSARNFTELDAGHLTGLHHKFWVQGKVSMRIIQDIFDPVYFFHEISQTGLDIDNDGCILAVSVIGPVDNDRVIDLMAVVAILAGPGISHSGDHVKRRHHGAVGGKGLIQTCEVP